MRPLPRGRLRGRGAGLLLAPLCFALTGCYAPLQTAGPERAVTLYREARAPSGAIALRREGREGRDRSAPRRAAGALDAAPGELTVDRAVAMAKENSAQLAALEARAATAAAEVEATGQYRNPELRVSQLRLDQILDGVPQVRTALRLSPSRPGEVDAKVAEARAAEAVTRAEARAAELDLEADVRWLFDDVLLLDAEIAAADAVAAARRALAARMRERLDASTATSIDEAMAELSAVEAEQDSAERRAQRRTTLGELFDRLGIDPAAPVRIVGDPLSAWPPPALPAEEALVEAALRRRPEIAIAAARIDATDARAFIERGKRWPWFSFVELGYEFAPSVPAGLGWTAQAGIDLPIFDTNRAAVAAADAARTAEKRALTAEVERVAREVRQRLREAQAAASLVTELKGRTLAAAERAGEETKRALEGRGIDAIRALTVDEHRVFVELRLLRLLRRYRTAVADLRRAVGGRLPAETGGDRRP